MRFNDWVLGLLLAALGAATLLAARDFPLLPRQSYGAGTFPAIIGALLLGLGGLLAFAGWRQRGPWFRWHGEVALSRVLLCLAVAVATVLLYGLLTPVLGFPVVAPLLLTLLIGWLSGGRWRLALGVALAASVLVWLAFAEVLHVPLGLGVLEEVVY